MAEFLGADAGDAADYNVLVDSSHAAGALPTLFVFIFFRRGVGVLELVPEGTKMLRGDGNDYYLCPARNFSRIGRYVNAEFLVLSAVRGE
tara:strand:+ start:172 stop:441 length:270 start_codon:yes stop_codon:yes gene_type:complete